jgi:hypothetical protein
MAGATGLSPAQLYSPTGTAIYGEGAQGAVIQDPTHGYAMAGGGKVPGIFVGRKDTVAARLTPGETVADRGLTSLMEDYFSSGGSSAVHVHFHGPVFGGRDKVAKELAPAIQSATDRVIRSRNRRG